MDDRTPIQKRKRWPWFVVVFLLAAVALPFFRKDPITVRAQAIQIGMTSEQVEKILGWHRMHQDGPASNPVHVEGFTGETTLDWIINEIVVEFGWYRYPRDPQKWPVLVYYDAEGRVERVQIK